MGTAVVATGSGIGALLCLAAYIVLHKHPSVNPVKTKGLLMMGVCLGIGGILGSLIHNLAAMVGKLLNGPVAVLLGAGVTLAVLFGIGFWLFLELRPKNKSPKKWLPWACAAFIIMIYVTGGTVEGIGNRAGNEALTQVGTALNDGLMALKF